MTNEFELIREVLLGPSPRNLPPRVLGLFDQGEGEEPIRDPSHRSFPPQWNFLEIRQSIASDRRQTERPTNARMQPGI